MRVLVVSDVHANLPALEAVLAHARGEYDALWSLGDVVGYGPYPNECIATLCEHPHSAISGNHDHAVLGRISLNDFNSDARQANLWTRDQLDERSRAYLSTLPETMVIDGFTLAHGSPRAPIWEYLLYARNAEESFGHFDTPVCLVGHTHVPLIFGQGRDGDQVDVLPPHPGLTVQLDEGRYIINPGSVGQPRDGDPTAAYLLLETGLGTFEHRRVAYDVDAMQTVMRSLGFAPRLIARLSFGW